MPLFRRQLSLFLPEPERSLVDAIRQRLDPRQHAIIPAHVTLCREAEIEDWSTIRTTLQSLDGVAVKLGFGLPERLQDGCILLPAQGNTAMYDDLRRKILGSACAIHLPHITLLHPRHSAGRDDDLAALAEETLPEIIQFRCVQVIEQMHGSKWHVIEQYGRFE